MREPGLKQSQAILSQAISLIPIRITEGQELPSTALISRILVLLLLYDGQFLKINNLLQLLTALLRSELHLWQLRHQHQVLGIRLSTKQAAVPPKATGFRALMLFRIINSLRLPLLVMQDMPFGLS